MLVMKNKKFLQNVMRSMAVMLGMVLFMVLFVSCDDHEPVDRRIHTGYILLSDGSVISDAVFDKSQHVPVAVVFAEKTDDHPVLAVMLDEISSIQFADTLSIDQKTSCSIDSCDGYSNTVALQTSNIKRTVLLDSTNVANPINYYKSPLGLAAFHSHWFFQSDFVPSVREMELLYSQLYRVNPIIEMCGGTPIGTTPDKAGCWYWTSTEVEENSLNQAWLFSMADGSRHKTPKTNSYRARLIVDYNPMGASINY